MDFAAFVSTLAEITHEHTAWFFLGTGVLAGIAHTFMGADHLAALMPLSVNRKLRAAWLGVRWGVGHSMGVIIVTLFLLLGRESLDLTIVEEWGERLVGVMLVALGLWGIRQAAKQNLHVHTHDHDGHDHTHLHAHVSDAHDPAAAVPHSHLHKHAALAAGTLHSLAGMAHLLGVLPALAAPTLLDSCSYLLGFASGSILSMAAFAGSFGVITAKLGSRSPSVLRGSLYVAASLCILVGLGWIILPLAGIELP